MPENKKYSASGFNEFLKTYKKKPTIEEPTQESNTGGFNFFAPMQTDAVTEALKQPGAMFNKGASQLMDNPLAGALNMAQGLVGIPFLMATVPLAFGEDMLKTFDKTIGTTDKEGKPSGVGNFISEGINGVFQTPAMLYDLGKKSIDAYLRTNGIAPEYVDSKVKEAMIATRLMPKGATEEQFKETQEALDEAGKLGATLLFFEGGKYVKNKLAPKVNEIKQIPKTEEQVVETPQKDVKQLQAPKGSFTQVNIDPTGRSTTIPRTENTQAYTKLELLRDELSAKKDKLVSDREILKKQAFDKNLTKEQRIDAKNRLKEVTAELNDVSERLPLINKELEAKRFEVESKPIPEQKLLTEGRQETIPTENVPSNINMVATGEPSQVTKTTKKGSSTKTVEGLPEEVGLPVSTRDSKNAQPNPLKDKNAQEPIVGDVAEVQKIERRTDKAGKEYYYNTETKKRTSKEEFEKQVKEEIKPEVETPKSEVKPIEKVEKPEAKSETATNPIDTKAVQEALISQKDKAIKEAIERNQKAPSGLNPLDYKESVKLGAMHLKNGVVKFADWSAQMIKDLGEKIKPQLLRIWNEVKKFGEDLGKIALEKVGEFVESKYNPARPLKMVDQSLFEPIKKSNVTEPKNAFSEGMKDIAQKDRETIKREYREAIKEKEKFSTKAKNLVKEVTDIKKVAKTVFEPISTSVEKVSKDVFRRFRMFGQSYQVNLLKRHEVVGDYFDIKSKSKMSADVKADFDISLMNGWFDDARKIAKEYGFEKQLDNVLKIKDDLAKELGVKTIENHFPRMVENFDGFVKFLEEKYPDYYKDNFSRMISEKANKIGRELTTEEKANLINNSLRGYNPGITLSDTGNMRKRIIQTLDGELAKFYHTPDASLLKYINEMTELSEARKFFGKSGYDVNESIGAYIQELRDGKKLDLEGSRELMEIFKARFNQRAISNKGITALRDIGVITKLGNPYSTMTQLKDLAYSLYFDPLRTPLEFGKILASKMGGKTPEWQIKELGIDPLKIAEELANPSKRKEYVQAFLDYSGFSKLDMLGKETLINTLWNKYQRQAKELKLSPEFERRIERYFGDGKEKAQVLSDLRNGKKTDSTAFLLYNELVGAQPISLTEMPRGYLRGGNFRIAYFLKTFSIRQLDFALNETIRVMRDKSLPKEQRRQGAYNLMKLGTSLALTGATVDQVRSYIMNALVGKKNDQTFSQDVLDNLLNVALLSRYDYTKIRQTGLAEALGSKMLPPMDFISDPLLYDLPNILSEKGKALRSTKELPMIGRFLYEYLKNEKKSSTNYNRNYSRSYNR